MTSVDRQDRFEKFSELVYSSGLRFARTIARDTEDAEDILQDALVKAFNSYMKADTPSLGSNWLYQIIRNVHIDRIRARNRRIQPVSYDEMTAANPDFNYVDPNADVEGEVLSNVTDPALELLIATLPLEQQKLVRLSLCDDIPDEEKAKFLNCTPSGYQKRLRTAKRALMQAARTQVS